MEKQTYTTLQIQAQPESTYDKIRLETIDKGKTEKVITRENTISRRRFWMKMILLMLTISLFVSTISSVAEVCFLKSSFQSRERPGNSNAEFAVQDFKFDRSTLHRYRYISKDDRTLSNYKFSKNMVMGNGSFRKYQGARGTRPFSRFERVYYEIDVYYKIVSNSSDDLLVFELGFSSNDTIDDHIYIGYQPESWSFYAVENEASNSIDVGVQVSQESTHTIKTLSPATENTTFQGTFAFFVNGPQREIMCFERRDNVLEQLHIFTNVYFVQQIYPVFGLYNPKYYHVNLNLKTKKAIKIPKQLYDFILYIHV